MFHNWSGYDAHLFIMELGKRFNKNDIGAVAENKEKYISFNVKINVKLAGVKYKDGTEVHKNIQLRFIDSCRSMASSLDKLVSNLCGTNGIQCDKCKDNMELINISDDYIASLGCKRCRTNMKGISDQDHEHAQQVWNIMEEKTLGCYHDTYLKTDLLLLADVFETFRNTCLGHYKLDPAHFYTAP